MDILAYAAHSKTVEKRGMYGPRNITPLLSSIRLRRPNLDRFLKRGICHVMQQPHAHHRQDI